MSKVNELTELLRPAAEALGYELLGIEYLGQGKHSVLRLYIDHENGITVEDCAKVSHQASGILEVEDPIKSQFHLEVSSPGSDRPLFSIEHFEQYVGREVNLRCHIGIGGRRKFKGDLIAVSDGVLTVVVDGQDYQIDFTDVDKANLVAKFD
ncbi:MAG: ribosome maturation factor RimP [Gammaproteobacteria bacterium]|nr:ribosome maturation factor RimP [Gammaproteobacteria bacterium]MDH5629346.1 ribosome maturation factor RimP [Gammaproteobacteria bacterium]